MLNVNPTIQPPGCLEVMKMDSILYSIKKMIGLDADYDAFDQDIIIHINTALMVLEQLAVAVDGFAITGPNETWDMALIDPKRLEGAKTYVYIRTKLKFDPPANATLVKVLEDAAKELEWRLNVKAEHIEAEG